MKHLSLVAFWLAVALPLFAARLLSMNLELGPSAEQMALPFLRGLASDTLISLITAIALYVFAKTASLFSRSPRTFLIATLLIISWLAACNAEHIHVNFANADFFFAKYGLTSAFLVGSMLSWSVVFKFAIVASVSAAGLLVGQKILGALFAKSCLFPYQLQLAGAFSFGLFAVLIFLPIPMEHPAWIGANVFEENAARAMQTTGPRSKAPLEASVKERFFSLDLSGRSIVKATEPTNVLILINEGMGRDDFDAGHFPLLKERAKRNLLISHLIDNQKQTDNGLYALLCGDYPNLASKESKASWMGTYGAHYDCLPKNLRDAGYATAFIQGAPLGFMRKDKFAQAAGFDFIRGSDDFTVAASRNGWGIDDGTLYRGVHEKILELSKSKSPWFISSLTSGTHHPYNVPPGELASGHGEATQTDAERFLDRQIDQTLNSLEQEGLLKNTLVLITGDEATPSHEDPGIHGQLGFNRSFLVVLTPQNLQSEIGERYLQSDVQASIDDYLGVKGARLGRSFFRTYAHPREIVFSNVFADHVYRRTEAIGSEPGRLLTCSFDFKTCKTFLLPANEQTLSTSEKEVSELKSIAAFNDLTTDDFNSGALFEEHGTTYHGSPFLLGSFRTILHENDHLTWTVRLKAADTNLNGVFVALQAFRPNEASTVIDEVVANKSAFLAPGQVLVLNETHRAFRSTEWIWTNLRVMADGSDETRVEEIQVHRDSPSLRKPASESLEILDSSVDSHLDLLKARPFNGCMGSDEETPRTILLASNCPQRVSLLSSGALMLRPGRQDDLEIDVEVVEGTMTFGASIDEVGHSLKIDGPKTIHAGETAHFAVSLAQPRATPTMINNSLVLLEATPGARFRVLRAALTLSK